MKRELKIFKTSKYAYYYNTMTNKKKQCSKIMTRLYLASSNVIFANFNPIDKRFSWKSQKSKVATRDHQQRQVKIERVQVQ